MKKIFFVLVLIFNTVLVLAQGAGDIKTEKIKVEGNCNMCKKRIEDAAYGKGIKSAEWDKHTHTLTLIYKSSKTSAHEVGTRVAKAGHDNELVKASETDYKKLPTCCAYKTATCDH